MASLSQTALDALLDQTFTVPVVLDPLHPPDTREPAYQAVVQRLPGMQFSFKPRTLLHAIGTKTVPVSIGHHEALRAAHRYLHVLSLDSGELRFRRSLDSDNRTNESREVGVGITCLLASRIWHFPWDQLEPIRGPGKRFDFRGEAGAIRGMFEAKGSTSESTQEKQIKHGLAKKAAHHARGDRVEVELIVATRIGTDQLSPNIVLADPPFEAPEDTFGPRGQKVYRYRHWARVMRYVGAPELAQAFYRDSNRLAHGQALPALARLPRVETPPSVLVADGLRFVGRWYDRWVPGEHRYEHLRQVERESDTRSPFEGPVQVFQGVVEEAFRIAEDRGPEELTADGGVSGDLEASDGIRVSVFPDGTAFAARVV